jgi:hypothetical protein
MPNGLRSASIRKRIRRYPDYTWLRTNRGINRLTDGKVFGTALHLKFDEADFDGYGL